MTRHPELHEAINIEHALEFSYKSHVTSGIDYLCLFRSKQLTIKAYFIDDGSHGEIVVPHNHRYDFESRVVRGSLYETQFSEIAGGILYNRYDYECIMDGGEGFVFSRPSSLVVASRRNYLPGDCFWNRAHRDIHTLTAIEPGTIVLQMQHADVGSSRTLAWVWAREIPDTSGSYQKMTRREVMSRVEELQEAMSRKD